MANSLFGPAWKFIDRVLPLWLSSWKAPKRDRFKKEFDGLLIAAIIADGLLVESISCSKIDGLRDTSCDCSGISFNLPDEWANGVIAKCLRPFWRFSSDDPLDDEFFRLGNEFFDWVSEFDPESRRSSKTDKVILLLEGSRVSLKTWHKKRFNYMIIFISNYKFVKSVEVLYLR